jgi:hypothetical protein
MDPNATLERIRAITARRTNWSEADELLDLVRELDEWLSKGGFLPDAWLYVHDSRRESPVVDQQPSGQEVT